MLQSMAMVLCPGLGALQVALVCVALNPMLIDNGAIGQWQLVSNGGGGK